MKTCNICGRTKARHSAARCRNIAHTRTQSAFAAYRRRVQASQRVVRAKRAEERRRAALGHLLATSPGATTACIVLLHPLLVWPRRFEAVTAALSWLPPDTLACLDLSHMTAAETATLRRELQRWLLRYLAHVDLADRPVPQALADKADAVQALVDRVTTIQQAIPAPGIH